MRNLQTILHYYRFDLSDASQRDAYNAMLAGEVGAIPFAWWIMNAEYGDFGATHKFMQKVKAFNGKRITLETAHLFDNQWNTAEGLRLWNRSEVKYPNKDIREGYYLTQTKAMAEALRNTHKCGYCGKQEPAAKGYVFCPHCLDSEYLKESDLKLTRMVPVRDTSKKLAELSDAERAHLLPLYRDAQKNGNTERGRARIEKAKRDIESDYAKMVRVATTKRDAKRWIVANMPGMLEQYIYYSHSDKHTFGWRDNGLSAEQVAIVLGCISEFPFGYEIVCADGRKLSAEN